jgi:undecaprenyl-diphosphatase
MMPGTSRSAAIIGGMTQGLSRKAQLNFLFPCCAYYVSCDCIFCICEKPGKRTDTAMKGYEMILQDENHIQLLY